MSDKKLTIAVKADIREGQKLQRFLTDLQREGSKTAKALQGISLSMVGKDSQRGGIAKAILENKKLFKELGTAGADLKKMFERDVGRGAQDATKRLSELNDKLKGLTDSYKRNREEVERLKKAGNYRGAREFVKAANVDRAGIYDVMGDMPNAKRMAAMFGNGQGAFGQMRQMAMSGIMQTPMGQMAMGLGPIAGALGIGSLVVDALKDSRQAAYLRETMGAGARAQSGSTMGRLDVSRQWGQMDEKLWDQLIGERVGGNDSVSRAGKAAGTLKYDEVTRSGKALDMISLNPFQIYRGGKRFAKSFMPWTPEYVESENADALIDAASDQAKLGQRENLKNADPKTKAQMDFMLAQKGAANMNAYRWGGTATSAMTWSSDMGRKMMLPPQLLEQVRNQLVDAAGRFGSTFVSAVSASVRHGMSAGAAASIATGGAAAGNTLGVLGGRGIGEGAPRETLGSGINAYLGSGSLISGTGLEAGNLAGALASGAVGNDAMQLRTLQMNQRGMGLLDNLTAGGADPWQKSVNLANAVTNFRGGSIYGQNALANLSFSDLVKYRNVPKDKLPAHLRGLGITTGMINAQYGDISRSITGRFADQKGDTSRAAMLMRTIRKDHGSDFEAWGKTASTEDVQMVSGLLANMSGGLFGGMTDAEGIANILTHRGGSRGGGGGKGGGSKPSDPIRDVVGQEFQFVGEQAKNLGDQLVGAAKAAAAAKAILDQAALSRPGPWAPVLTTK